MHRFWRPYWTTPGLTETPRPVLDQIVNRDLTVKRNLNVLGDLNVSGNINLPPWITYSPTLDYQSAGTSTYTSVGHYRKIGRGVTFVMYFNVTVVPTSWRGNVFGSLPPFVPAFYVSAIGIWNPCPGGVPSTDPLKQGTITGSAKAGATQLLTFPTQGSYYNGTATVPIYMYTVWVNNGANPYEYWLSGQYETAT